MACGAAPSPAPASCGGDVVPETPPSAGNPAPSGCGEVNVVSECGLPGRCSDAGEVVAATPEREGPQPTAHSAPVQLVDAAQAAQPASAGNVVKASPLPTNDNKTPAGDVGGERASPSDAELCALLESTERRQRGGPPTLVSSNAEVCVTHAMAAAAFAADGSSSPAAMVGAVAIPAARGPAAEGEPPGAQHVASPVQGLLQPPDLKPPARCDSLSARLQLWLDEDVPAAMCPAAPTPAKLPRSHSHALQHCEQGSGAAAPAATAPPPLQQEQQQMEAGTPGRSIPQMPVQQVLLDQQSPQLRQQLTPCKRQQLELRQIHGNALDCAAPPQRPQLPQPLPQALPQRQQPPRHKQALPLSPSLSRLRDSTVMEAAGQVTSAHGVLPMQGQAGAAGGHLTVPALPLAVATARDLLHAAPLGCVSAETLGHRRHSTEQEQQPLWSISPSAPYHRSGGSAASLTPGMLALADQLEAQYAADAQRQEAVQLVAAAAAALPPRPPTAASMPGGGGGGTSSNCALAGKAGSPLRGKKLFASAYGCVDTSDLVQGGGGGARTGLPPPAAWPGQGPVPSLQLAISHAAHAGKPSAANMANEENLAAIGVPPENDCCDSEDDGIESDESDELLGVGGHKVFSQAAAVARIACMTQAQDEEARIWAQLERSARLAQESAEAAMVAGGGGGASGGHINAASVAAGGAGSAVNSSAVLGQLQQQAALKQQPTPRQRPAMPGVMQQRQGQAVHAHAAEECVHRPEAATGGGTTTSPSARSASHNGQEGQRMASSAPGQSSNQLPPPLQPQQQQQQHISVDPVLRQLASYLPHAILDAYARAGALSDLYHWQVRAPWTRGASPQHWSGHMCAVDYGCMLA